MRGLGFRNQGMGGTGELGGRVEGFRVQESGHGGDVGVREEGGEFGW